MLSRFELLVVVRTQLRDRGALRRALAVEAAMEALAGALGADVEDHGLAGLGSGLDAELCAANPERRGLVAAELLATEGAPAAVAAAVGQRWRGAVEALTPLGAALVVAEVMVERALDAVDGDDAVTLDELEAFALARGLTRAAGRGDGASARALAALARLGLDPEQGATLVLAGLGLARADLRL